MLYNYEHVRLYLHAKTPANLHSWSRTEALALVVLVSYQRDNSLEITLWFGGVNRLSTSYSTNDRLSTIVKFLGKKKKSQSTAALFAKTVTLQPPLSSHCHESSACATSHFYVWFHKALSTACISSTLLMLLVVTDVHFPAEWKYICNTTGHGLFKTWHA